MDDLCTSGAGRLPGSGDRDLATPPSFHVAGRGDFFQTALTADHPIRSGVNLSVLKARADAAVVARARFGGTFPSAYDARRAALKTDRRHGAGA